jgi:hypothetical protein
MPAPSLYTRVRLHQALYVAAMTRALSSGRPSSSPFSRSLRGRFDCKAVPSESTFLRGRSRSASASCHQATDAGENPAQARTDNPKKGA